MIKYDLFTCVPIWFLQILGVLHFTHKLNLCFYWMRIIWLSRLISVHFWNLECPFLGRELGGLSSYDSDTSLLYNPQVGLFFLENQTFVQRIVVKGVDFLSSMCKEIFCVCGYFAWYIVRLKNLVLDSSLVFGIQRMHGPGTI